MKKTLLVLLALTAIGGLVYTLIPSAEDVAQQLDRAQVGDAKQTTTIESLSGGRIIELSADNTKISFACAKNLAGKTLTMRGGWSHAFGSQLMGRAVVDPENQSVLQIELQIDVGSLWSEHDQLTEALITKGFFQVEEHPRATFISTNIEVSTSNTGVQQDVTHQIEGNFTLNGIEKSISFPARIQLLESGLQLHSRFSLQRKDFNVIFTDSAGFGLLTDENISDLVALDITISTAGDSTNGTVVRSGNNHGKPATGNEIDFFKLPTTYTETIPATQVQFEMVLAPGAAEREIPPLYVGKHEVTWNEFMPWVDGRDLEDSDALGELRAMKLRPSPPYGSVDRGFGMDRRPALSMSLLSAEQYCQWLSQQTGKSYRLPTQQEWEHLYTLGGGRLDTPPTADEALRLAVFADNAWDDDIDDWATKPVGSSQPNILGVYDMAGNVCEWVRETGGERIALGGHFDSEREELGVGRHVEDPAWNRDYPNEPKSVWWFVNARWVGFRVVCEVTSH